MPQRVVLALENLLFAFIVAALVSTSGAVPSTDPGDRARRFTLAIEFDFVSWTVNAAYVKLGQSALDTPFHFDEAARHRLVVDYLRLMENILWDEYNLRLAYTDPSILDPESASAGWRADLASLYARQRQLAPLAESVLQEQVSAVLADLGLTTGGQPVPPVAFHISPLPYNLIISPRDKIRQDASISLLPDLTVDRATALEAEVAAALDVSTLVVPVGGIGSYPTMVMRTTSLDWLAEVVAHEWIHNWLTLRPLGFNYSTTPELRTMNETAASIAGTEISLLVLERYYPELYAERSRSMAAAGAIRTVSLPLGPVGVGGLPRLPFDFRAEMHTTRVRVDELLAAGKIVEAEAYMEQRRQLFWDNGYPIRKLNQAYFAFYGAYADAPGGAAGEDPVGPAVRALREQSGSLAEFLKTIAAMNSFQQLQDALAK
ncbi:MAG: hypothetical protein FD146_1275 [Anaerolineaceae bacterium]|nr:MAG: hypothetical protein FD146_1275 [Anaerolineaceae bacterium]